MNTANMSDDMLLMVTEVKMALLALDYCCLDHDADISLVINHTSGTRVITNMYAHAALIHGLMDALEYFLSEL